MKLLNSLISRNTLSIASALVCGVTHRDCAIDGSVALNGSVAILLKVNRIFFNKQDEHKRTAE